MSNPETIIIDNKNMTVEKCFQIGHIMRKRIDRVLSIGRNESTGGDKRRRCELIIFKLHFQMMKLSKMVFELDETLSDEFNDVFELGFLGGKKRKS